MKTVILCGGQGTRMREETEFKPKPLADIGGMPILWHIMKIYGSQGHKQFVLALGYKGEMIKEFFVNYQWMANNFSLKLRNKEMKSTDGGFADEDWTVDCIDTGLDSLTGRRLFRLKKYLANEENFMLTYGDGVADVDLRALARQHEKSGAIITLTGVSVDSNFGVLDIEGGTVRGFAEKKRSGDVINGGFMMVNKRIFDHLTDDNTMLEFDLIPKLAKKGEVAVYRHGGFWHCMDTYRDYLKLNEIWKGKPQWKVW